MQSALPCRSAGLSVLKMEPAVEMMVVMMMVRRRVMKVMMMMVMILVGQEGCQFRRWNLRCKD